MPNVFSSNAEAAASPHMPLSPRVVLQEIFKLLEEYAPSWYTEEHHNRIVAALISPLVTNHTDS